MRGLSRLLWAAGLVALAAWIKTQYQEVFVQIQTGGYSAHYFLDGRLYPWQVVGENLLILWGLLLKGEILPLALLFIAALIATGRIPGQTVSQTPSLPGQIPDPSACLPKHSGRVLRLDLAGAALLAWVLVVGLVQQVAICDFPFSGDETSYLLQAELLRHGLLKGAGPADMADFFQTPSVIWRDTVYSKYQVGWPCLLALGGLMGFRAWICPALGLLSLVALDGLAQYLPLTPAARRAGVVGLAFSPFFLFNCASYGIHIASLSFVLLFLWAWLRLCRDPSQGRWQAWSVVALVAIANIRVVDLILPGVASLLLRPRGWRPYLALTLGLGIGLLLLGITNQLQNGHPLQLGFTVYDPTDRWGLGVRGHNGLRMIWNQSYSLGRWMTWMPAGWGLLAVVGFFSSAGQSWPVRALTLAALAQLAFYACHFSLGVVEYGPRYWMNATAILSLLAGQGLVTASGALSGLRSSSLRPAGEAARSGPWLTSLATILFLHTLLSLTAISRACHQRIAPDALSYRACLKDVQSRGTPSLVFVTAEPGSRTPMWVRFNSPFLDGPVLFVHFLAPPENAHLMKTFPNRKGWRLRLSTSSDGQAAYALKAYSLEDTLKEDGDAWRAAGENYLTEVNSPDKARACFEHILKLEPANPLAHGYLGRVALDKKDYRSAARHLTESLKAMPQNGVVRYQLATALSQMGQIEQARPHMEAVMMGPAGFEADRATDWLLAHQL